MNKLSILIISLFLLWGCVAFDEMGTTETTESPSFSIEEAQKIFETQYTQTLTKTKTDSHPSTHKFSPGDFTPLWDHGKYSSMRGKSGYDIPISAGKKLKAIRTTYYGNDAKAYKTNLPQRLLVMKNEETGSTFCYILTLIPDIGSSSGDKAMSDFITYTQKKGSFSGLAIYTVPGTDALARVSRYKDGKKTDGVFLPKGNGSYIQRLRKSVTLLSGTKILTAVPIQTRSDYDDIWDDIYNDYDWSVDEPDYTDIGDGLFQDDNGNYYVDLDEDGYPDIPCLPPAVTTDEYPEDPEDPEFGEDSGYTEQNPIDPNEETGNLEGDNSDNNDNSSSSFEELMAIPFDNIDLMDKAWFVGYDKSHDCLKGCYAILDNMGIDEHGSSAEVIYLARENESHTALENYGNNVEENYKNAVNCINDHLEEGRAIIVGADYKLGNDANDGTIDHFVLIVGCGFDEILNENYYIYVETGTYHDYKGVNPEDNRFYYDQEKEMFVDEQNYSNKELTITEIRPNNGEEYDTISQPSKY